MRTREILHEDQRRRLLRFIGQSFAGCWVVALLGFSGWVLHFNPAPHDIIHSGDHLIVMGHPQGLQHLEKLASEGA